MPKKILAFVHAYSGHGREAGAETTLANLLESMVRAGWRADVLLSQPYENYREPYYQNGVWVLPYQYKTELNDIIKDYDAVITHLECSERTVIVARTHGVPVVQLVHNTLWQTEGYLAEGTDLAVYNSDWVAEHHTKARTSPLVTIPVKGDGGLHANKISFRARSASTWDSVIVHPQIEPATYQTRIGSHDHITMINMYENKGPEIFYEMARRFPQHKFLAVLGGYGEQMIVDLPNVEIVKNTRNIRDVVYRRTKVLLMPSDYETFGRCAIEAAASGIPTVANPTSGLVEALGEDGLYADRSNLDEWAVNIELLMDHQTYYQQQSDTALRRSAYWAQVRETETTNFVEKINALR